MQRLTTFLMFEGAAEKAIQFYLTLFEDSKIIAISRYGKEGPGPEGSVIHATFQLAGQEFMAIDSHVKHAFTFTPAISIYVQCKSEQELDKLYAALPVDGKVMMEAGNYGFSKKFAWIADRFGVSWQLNLAK